MKYTDDKLQAALRRQLEAVVLIDVDGSERHGISAQYAAGFIAGRGFIGYGKSGVVECVRAVDAPQRGPFATRHDVAAVMADFPRLMHAGKNPQDPGAKHWVQQPVFSSTGRPGKVATVHLG